MLKLFIVFVFIFLHFSGIAFAEGEELHIISRSEWGADESLRYYDGEAWLQIRESWRNAGTSTPTAEEQQKQEEAREKRKQIDTYLLEEYAGDNTLVEVTSEEGEHPLAWKIQKTQYVQGIVIHHTHSEYTDTISGIQSIYRYHAISRQWGDIGYNYIIGYDGEIYEGRAGGDYVVAAHSLRNNRSTVGIAVMGNYDEEPVSEAQYAALKKLVTYLVKKYGIDVSKQYHYHKDCFGESCDFYVETREDSPIVGHRDTGHTDCPGDELYKQIALLRQELIPITAGLAPVPYTAVSTTKVTSNSKIEGALEKLPQYTLLKLLVQVEEQIDATTDMSKKTRLLLLKNIIQKIYEEKFGFTEGDDKRTSSDDTEYIKIKLSYPEDDHISITSGNKTYDIQVAGDGLEVQGKKYRVLRVQSPECREGYRSTQCGFVQINSWERVPSWDTEKKYNDNTFRGEIILYVVDGKLVVVNRLLLGDYLKGLGEVNDSTPKEKIKTIIVAARTYARWYMKEARKFEGAYYDGSDNPDEFQRYLGRGLELRTPLVSQIVAETKDQVITYEGKLIKPWYFSSSDGRTRSFYEYCIANTGNVISCQNQFKDNYPYLMGVKDLGGKGKTLSGHGVGISGVGSTYLASKNWTYDMIISYYLRDTRIESL